MILREMLASNDSEVAPNVVSFNCVIKAWSFVRDPIAVSKVTDLLKELLDQTDKNPKLRPNASTFGSVLKTLADSQLHDKAKRAEAVVRLAEKCNVKLTDWGRNQLSKCQTGERARGARRRRLEDLPELSYSKQ